MRLVNDITVYDKRFTWTYRLVIVLHIRQHIGTMMRREKCLEFLSSLNKAAVAL